jgi:lipoprotein-anchoring transpeptidase ErfK/SrfK
MPPQNTKLGSEIYIHGCGAVRDWTEGCIALADEDIKEIFDSIPIGTRVNITP